MIDINIYTEMTADRFDVHIARNTGFKSMAELCADRSFVGSPSTYRPSCDCSQPFMRTLAFRFDNEMRRRGDDRRAYLYGNSDAKELARWGR